MKRLAALAACVLLLAGCDGDTVRAGDAGDGIIRVWHDNQRSVTCWVYRGPNRGGLSCIPDSQLAKSSDPECRGNGLREAPAEPGFRSECIPGWEDER